MSLRSVFSLRNRWFTGSVAFLVVFGAIAAAIAFVVLPRAHARDAMASLWESICRAAGAPGRFQGADLPADLASFPSGVVVTAHMMGARDDQSVGRGATLALACSMCHGARGTSPAGTPHLAGQPASSTYKQLRDYKSGHRQSVIMQPMVANLDDQAMRDLAAFYSTLARERHGVPVSRETPRLVRNGDPMRNIGACSSCHSPRAQRTGTPVLEGMNNAYLHTQLQAFRSATRRNDINGQMRNSARQLTDKEVDELAQYYATR